MNKTPVPYLFSFKEGHAYYLEVKEHNYYLTVKEEDRVTLGFDLGKKYVYPHDKDMRWAYFKHTDQQEKIERTYYLKLSEYPKIQIAFNPAADAKPGLLLKLLLQ